MSKTVSILPGQLNTSDHPSALSEKDGELQAAVRCLRNRRIFGPDKAYRQIDPAKTPNPVIAPPQDCTGFCAAAYQGTGRFLLAKGDALFYSIPSTSEAFLERATDGSTTLMADCLVHSSTDEWTGKSAMCQHKGNWCVANRAFVRRVGIVDPTDDGLLYKSYDPSIYEGYYELADNYTTISHSGAVATTGGTPPTTTIVNGSVRVIDAYFPANVDFVEYTTTTTWGAAQDFPNPTYEQWAMVIVSRDADGATFPGYDANTPYNAQYQNGNDPTIVFGDGVNTLTRPGYFLFSGGKMYLFFQIEPDADGVPGAMTQFTTCAITYTVATSAEQKLTISPLYFVGKPLPSITGETNDINDFASLDDRGFLAGYGPVWDDDEYMNYAFRGSDGGETVFGDPYLVQLRMRDLFKQDHFETGCPAMPQKVTITPGFVLSGGHTNVQVLRKTTSSNQWYRIGLILNDGAASHVDAIYQTILVAGTLVSISPNPPRVTDIVSCAEWKGHLVLGDYLGRLFFSDQLDPSVFIWRDYTEGGTLTGVTTQPRSLDVGGQNDTILGIVGLDSIIALTRRRIYYMQGANAVEAVGPFQVENERGCLGPFAWCSAGNGALVASDDGLYLIQIAPNALGRSGDVRSENLTIAKQHASWLELIGDDTERQRVSVVFAASEIWCFRDEFWMHRCESGYWSTGEWANGKQVVKAETDGLGRIAVAFTDTSVGYIGVFPTDGGVELAGEDGTPFTWYADSKKYNIPALVKRIDREGEGGVVVFSEVNPAGFECNLIADKVNVGVPPGNQGRWFTIRVTGGSEDETEAVRVEIEQGPDGRNRLGSSAIISPVPVAPS